MQMIDHQEMKAGFAKENITPKKGTLMEGLGQKMPASSIHDELFVRVLSLSCEGKEVALISMDILFLERGQVDRIKGAIGNLTGLRPAEILINFTHTHCSPRVTRWAYFGNVEESYISHIERGTLRAIVAARANRKAVTIEAGSTTTDLPVNRRLPNAEGVAEWKPNFEGPTVTALPFCLFREKESGRVLSLLFSVACHPSMIYEFAISAEFPGAAVRHLNHDFATDGSMFFQGAAGDAKPRPAAGDGTRWIPCSWEQMEEVGKDLASRVKEAAQKAHAVEPAITTELREVSWRQLAPPTETDLNAVIAAPEERPNRKAWATEMSEVLALRGDLPSEAGVLLHVIGLGVGLRIVAVEGEVLARLGQRLLAEIPPGVTFLLGYSNGTAVYLPDREDVPFGGYEVDSFWEYHQPSGPALDCDDPLIQAVRSAIA